MSSVVASLTRLPVRLAPAVRRLWAEKLFPGATAPAEPTRAASWLVLVVLPALLIYPVLGFHLFEPDEGRYAEIPREMLARGDWLVPHLQGRPYLDKPPLLYWLVMLSYSTFGVEAWAARLVPALAVHGLILATYAFGCRAFGERRGLRAALLLSVMPSMVGVGRVLTLDGLLTLWVTLGLFAGYRVATPGRSTLWVLAWTCACGLGVLTKGPIAILLAVGPLVAWRWCHPQRTVAMSARLWLAFAAGVIAINLPWYVAVCVRQPEFFTYFFWQHNLQRFFAPFDHVEPFWYFAPILLAGLFPAVLALPTMCRAMTRAEHAPRRSPELAFVLMAGLGCVGFFSLSGSKLPTYILPAFPPLALAVAVLIEQGEALFTRRQWTVGLSWLAALAAILWVVLPMYAQARSPFRDEEIVRKHCADPSVVVACFPRTADSIGFYLGRDDLRPTRSKDILRLMDECRQRPQTVVLFTHRNSLTTFRAHLPADLVLEPVADFRKPSIFGDVPWGLCDMAIVRPR